MLLPPPLDDVVDAAAAWVVSLNWLRRDAKPDMVITLQLVLVYVGMELINHAKSRSTHQP